MSSISLTLGLRGRLLSGTQVTLQGTLFGNNEPGFTFEPWDITTLYQDRAGTTPVTAAGQSVGLRLDKSQGLALGPELVTNGTFDTDIDGWTSSLGSPTLSWVATGAMRITRTAAPVSYSVVQQTISGLVVGRRYNLTAIFSNVASGANPYVAVNSVATGTDRLSFIATATSHILEINTTTGAIGSSFDVDNISVRELAGNHQVAISDAKRGVYGWLPKTGRRNLLTYSEQFDNAAWVKQEVTISANSTTAPDGTATADKLTPTAVASPHQITQLGVVSSQACTLTFYAKSAGYTSVTTLDGALGVNGSNFNLASGTVTNAGTGLGSITPLSDGWYKCVTKYTTTGVRIYVDNSLSFTGDGTSGIYLWGAQLEIGSTATAYQRVVSQYDITEAGVPTCYYVQADGVDDAYVTPTITPNTDKVQVFAGVRKLSDAATGVVAEFSTDSVSNNGAIGLFAPAGTVGVDAQRISGIVRGTAVEFYRPSATYVAPTTRIATLLADIAGVRSLRLDGVVVDTRTTVQSSNFLAYPAYIYGRAGTSLPFNGLDFGHAVRFGPNLDAATIARVESLIARNTPEVTL